MAFPMAPEVLINVWRDTCLSCESKLVLESTPGTISGTFNSFYREHELKSFDLQAKLPSLKAQRGALTPISTMGILLGGKPYKKPISTGLRISIKEEEEGHDHDQISLVSSSEVPNISTTGDDDSEITDEEQVQITDFEDQNMSKEDDSDNNDKANDNDNENDFDVADITPTVENTGFLNIAMPLFERKDSARTINSTITDEDEDAHIDIDDIQSHRIPSKSTTNSSIERSITASVASIKSNVKPALLSPVLSTNTDSSSSPFGKQGKHLPNGLKTFGRFILPKLGHHSSQSQDKAIIDSHPILSQSEHNLAEELELDKLRSQRLMSKRKPPPSSKSLSENNSLILSRKLTMTSTNNSQSSSISPNEEDTDIDGNGDQNQNQNHHSIGDSDSDSDSVVDSIESSDIVDSDYDYYSTSPNNTEGYYHERDDDDNRIVDDLDSDDYTNEDDMYDDSFYDDDDLTRYNMNGSSRRSSLLPNNTAPNSYIRGGVSNEISQINFKRLRRQDHNVRKIANSERRNSNTLPSSQILKLDLEENEEEMKKNQCKAKNNNNTIDADPTDNDNDEPIDHLRFEKLQISKESKNKVESTLTSLLNKTAISLNYYSYVGNVQNVGDHLVTIHVLINNSNLTLKVNDSTHVVDLIGFCLYQYNKTNGGQKSDSKFQDPNYWKIFMIDSDGEIDDDFGPLDRTRVLKTYGGADEFTISLCSDKEHDSNELITPSPLKKSNTDHIPAAGATTAAASASAQPAANLSMNSVNANRDDLMEINGTLPSNLTPIDGIKLGKQIIDSPKIRTNNHDHHNALIEEAAVEDDDSDEEAQRGEERISDIKKYLRRKQTDPTNVASTFIDKNKDGALSKLKSSSKTIQSILHNTADHYQLTQEQLFNGGGIIDDDGNNLLSTYHRWTIWRRQQMSFKNKQPKTLTVDGYQIYILPFNELDGSWYELKTYSFNISQVMKVKQSVKVPTHFKIVVNKNKEGIVKKYYLEAKSEKECSEIVNTIKYLAKSIHQLQ